MGWFLPSAIVVRFILKDEHANSFYCQSMSVYYICTYLKDLSQRSICITLHTTNQRSRHFLSQETTSMRLSPCDAMWLPGRFDNCMWSPVHFSELLLNVLTWLCLRSFKFELFKLTSWSDHSIQLLPSQYQVSGSSSHGFSQIGILALSWWLCHQGSLR